MILIGKAEKVSSFGETPYLVAVLYGFNTLGAKRVYLLARGAKNVKIGKKVLNKMPPHHKCVFQTEELLIMNSEKIPSMCCVLE